jgi:hypothetical protein
VSLDDATDGHRCVYTQRAGKGPRGGRRTWTRARCVACEASAEVQDFRSGEDSSWAARTVLQKHAPRCPVPLRPLPAERALRDLAIAAKRAEAALPQLAWAVEFMPDGGDPDEAIQRAWRECESPEAMREALAAFGAGGRFLRGHSGDEVGGREYVAFEVDGLAVDLHGAATAVCAALRLHFPRLEWRKAVRP